MIRVLLLDNHDSFTYNLAELLRRNGKVTFQIHTAETLSVQDVEHFDKILLSPGPGIPQEHKAIFEILEKYGETKSVFGVCLGMQAIAIHFGGTLFNLEKVVHGQVKTIFRRGSDPRLFKGMPKEFDVGLYHSWAVDPSRLPEELIVTAFSADGIIMGIRHQRFDIHGVQFHPESIMTPLGQQIIDNWLNYSLAR